jgi:hypothetical protein
MSTIRNVALTALVLAGCGGEYSDTICDQALAHVSACVHGAIDDVAPTVCDDTAAAQAEQILQMDCGKIQESSRQKADYINGPFKGCDEPCFTAVFGLFCSPKSRWALPPHILRQCCIYNDQFRWRSPDCHDHDDSPWDDKGPQYPPPPNPNDPNWGNNPNPNDPSWGNDPNANGGHYGPCTGMAGVCRDDRNSYCPTGFVTGKCPNYPQSYIRCCPSGPNNYNAPSGGDYGPCTGMAGVCKDDRNSHCPTGFVTGKCPNYPQSYIRCCPTW